MIDTTQILLISAITVMTVILTVIGIQLVFVLKDLRIFLTKANNIISELEKIGLGVEHGYSDFLGFFTGIKKFFTIMDYISEKKSKK